LTALIGLAVFASLAAGAAVAAGVSDIKYPKLNEIQLPKVERVALENGMVLMLVEDRELPLIKMRAMVKAGTTYEPRERRGLSELMSEAWRTGGTTSKSGDEIDELLEAMGSSVEGSVDYNAAHLTASSLVENFDKTLAVFVDILEHPGFSEDKIELAKTHMRSSIARRNDEPMGILMREYPKLVYGPDSPYARQYEYTDVDRLSRADLLDFHGKYFHPGGVILGVYGDFSAADMKTKLESAFAGWPAAKVEYPSVAEVDMTLTPSVHYIEKTDIEQCFILMGHMCMRLDDPDYPSFYVMSDILGGGWTSRIFKKVRTEKGLAYSAGGGLMSEFDHPGPFYTFSSTKFASAHEVITTMLDEIRRITETEVTDQELELAKNGYLNSFAFKFDSVGKILERLMVYQFFGYPEDFLQRTRAAIEKVTKEDILAVAKRRLHPDKMIILAVGDASRFDKPLSTLGAVNTIDITIPEPKESVPEATQASSDKAKQIVEKVVAAAGGADKIMAVKNVSDSFKATVTTPGGEMVLDAKIVLAYPDRMRLDIVTPMGTMVQVLNKDKAWMSSPQGVMDLQGSQADELRKQVQFDQLSVLKALASGAAGAQYVGEAQLDGKKVHDVLLTLGEDAVVHAYVDPASNMIVGTMRKMFTMDGPTDVTEVYSDFRDVSGIKVSFASAQRTATKTISTTKVTEIKINPPLEAAAFEKPKS
jgi:predicted Zn-dependent peptidase/outer membrane lipoprotein-sorting protein